FAQNVRTGQQVRPGGVGISFAGSVVTRDDLLKPDGNGAPLTDVSGRQFRADIPDQFFRVAHRHVSPSVPKVTSSMCVLQWPAGTASATFRHGIKAFPTPYSGPASSPKWRRITETIVLS